MSKKLWFIDTYECFSVKHFSKVFLEHGKISFVPTVFLIPNKSNIPLFSSNYKTRIIDKVTEKITLYTW